MKLYYTSLTTVSLDEWLLVVKLLQMQLDYFFLIMHKKTTTVCFNLRYIHKFTDHVHHQKKLADLQIIVMCNVAVNYCCMFFLRKSADQMEVTTCT